MKWMILQFIAAGLLMTFGCSHYEIHSDYDDGCSGRDGRTGKRGDEGWRDDGWR